MSDPVKAFEQALRNRSASAGSDILDALVDRRATVEIYRKIKVQDEQTANLFREVLARLRTELEPARGTGEALNRVQGLVLKGSTWDAAMFRNNVFKAADALGVKLPSSSF